MGGKKTKQFFKPVGKVIHNVVKSVGNAASDVGNFVGGMVQKPKEIFAPIYDPKDYGGSYFNINKDINPQLQDLDVDKWGRKTQNIVERNKQAAQGRYDNLLTQSKGLMSGAGPAVEGPTTQATAPTPQGMGFVAPPTSKKKQTLLTGADQGSLFTR